jgi:hypothetical protein
MLVWLERAIETQLRGSESGHHGSGNEWQAQRRRVHPDGTPGSRIPLAAPPLGQDQSA